MSTTSPPKDTLLVVDDTLDNVTVLLEFLSSVGFKVLVAQDGEEAIQTAEYAQPDLILLDIMMPGIDGFAVCRTLKSQANTHHIPIIFMTALVDTNDKIKGFQLGAADYITKPFQQEEVLARINAHLHLHKLKQALQEHNQQLQAEIAVRQQTELSLKQTADLLVERTVELQDRTIELEKRNLELDAFAHTVAHDLKNPLGALVGVTELLVASYPVNSVLDTQGINRLHLLTQMGEQMLSIVDALLLLAGVSKQSDVETHPLDMAAIVNQVLQQRLPHLLKKYAGEIQLPTTYPIVKGYAPWVAEVWFNYLSNALKYGGRPPQVEVGITPQTDDTVRFWVRDNGAGLSTTAQTQLFTPFTRLHKGRVEGHGLGLSIVKHIVEKLGGQVGVESELHHGSLFYFTLPT